MDFIIILMFSLYQLKICETGRIRALILHVYRMGLFQTVISGLIYFQIQTLSNVNLDKTCPFEKPAMLMGYFHEKGGRVLVATPRCMFLVSLFWRWDVVSLP
jgi:hypothetical protein